MRRHELAIVSPIGWRTVLAERRELAADPLVAHWAEKGWPLVRRRGAATGCGMPLGLPLPPSAGKRRLEFVVPVEAIVSIAPPLSLDTANRCAPREWQPTLDRLHALASAHALEARVCGSLAWNALTSLDYLTDGSDLDVLLYLGRATDLSRVTAGLARIGAEAPMRLDGELIREDDLAVNWRELHHGGHEILVKTTSGIGLISPSLFQANGTPQW